MGKMPEAQNFLIPPRICKKWDSYTLDLTVPLKDFLLRKFVTQFPHEPFKLETHMDNELLYRGTDIRAQYSSSFLFRLFKVSLCQSFSRLIQDKIFTLDLHLL